MDKTMLPARGSIVLIWFTTHLLGCNWFASGLRLCHFCYSGMMCVHDQNSWCVRICADLCGDEYIVIGVEIFLFVVWKPTLLWYTFIPLGRRPPSSTGACRSDPSWWPESLSVEFYVSSYGSCFGETTLHSRKIDSPYSKPFYLTF